MYEWDGENRLKAAYVANPTTTDDKKVVFTYDYMSRRVRKESFFWSTDHWQLTTDQSFVYDEWNVIMVLDGLNSNAITRKYTWGLDLSGTFHNAGGIGGLLAVEETAGTHQGSYWYFYDANGNVGQLVKGSDASLPIAASYEYDAYGNALVTDGTYAAANTFRFSTKWQDNQTGLYYFGYRYLDSKQGRWISRDPIEERGGLQLLCYVRNNPFNLWDFLGLYMTPFPPGGGGGGPSVPFDPGSPWPPGAPDPPDRCPERQKCHDDCNDDFTKCGIRVAISCGFSLIGGPKVVAGCVLGGLAVCAYDSYTCHKDCGKLNCGCAE